jgi:hypothetical protein
MALEDKPCPEYPHHEWDLLQVVYNVMNGLAPPLGFPMA